MLRRRATPDDPRQVLVAIFFLFAPIGSLLGLVHSTPVGWFTGLLYSVLSGALAVGWAWMFQRGGRRFFLMILLIGGPILLVPQMFRWAAQSGFLSPGLGLSELARQITLFAMAIVELAIGFTLLAVHLARTESAAARARAELDIARDVHASIVPALDIRAGGWRVVARSIPSSTMGGDLIDATSSPDGLTVILADVSGHGVKAGIVMAMLKAAVRTRLAAPGDLGGLLGDVNRALADLIEPSMFATAACVRLGTGGQIEYALAGHLPILLLHPGGELHEFPNQSLPLAVERTEAFVSGRASLQPGQSVVMITDGLIEVQDQAGRELGLAEVCSLIATHGAADPHALVNAIMARAEQHGRRGDDQSVVVIRAS